MQFFIGCSTASPVAAAASTLQLRAISNFGTSSATAMTNCELKIIIEIEIGIFGPLLVVGLTRLKKRGPGQLVQFLFNQNSYRAKTDRRSPRSLSHFAYKITPASIISQPHDQPARLLYCRGRALLKGRKKRGRGEIIADFRRSSCPAACPATDLRPGADWPCFSDASATGRRQTFNPRMTAARRIRHRGEHGISRKTIAQGMPGLLRCTCGDYARVLHLICTRGYGCIGHPAFPAPSVIEARTVLAKPLAPRAARSRRYV
jgi:hypothetical protein